MILPHQSETQIDEIEFKYFVSTEDIKMSNQIRFTFNDDHMFEYSVNDDSFTFQVRFVKEHIRSYNELIKNMKCNGVFIAYFIPIQGYLTIVVINGVTKFMFTGIEEDHKDLRFQLKNEQCIEAFEKWFEKSNE